MTSRDKSYRPPSRSDSEDTPPETSCSQMSLSSVGTPITPSISKSLGHFTFATPTPAPSPRIRKPKRKRARFLGNQYLRREHQRDRHKKFMNVCTTTPETVRVPPTSKDSAASRKLDFSGSSFLPSKQNINVRSSEGKVEEVDVLPITGNVIINVESFISILGEVAVCRNCQLGTLELYQKSYHLSCATQLMFRCNNCLTNRTFWSVSGYFRSSIQLGEKMISKRNDIMYSSVLGGRLVGMGEPNLRLYHASMNLPPPPNGASFQRIQKDLLIASEYVANISMMKAKIGLEAIFGINPLTNCVHGVVSFDGAYQIRSKKGGGGYSPYCFAAAISVDTGMVVAYDVACNNCRQCNMYSSKFRENEITEDEHHNWYIEHESTCPAKYSEYASVHLESLLAPLVVRQAYDRGIIFSGVVSDGDNKTDAALKDAGIYKKLGFDLEIGRLECLSHVLKRMKSNLCKKQEGVLKDARTSKKVHTKELMKKGKSKKDASKLLSQEYAGTLRKVSKSRESWKSSGTSVEIKHLSEAMCGQIASYYRLAVQRNKGDIDSIIKAVRAIPYHLGANDNNAEEYHQFCPFEERSWCQYQSAKYGKKPPPHHPNYLSEEAVNIVLELYDEFKLDTAGFIEKIKTSLTSNNNEAIHSVLFDIVPKKENIGFELMRLGSALAVIQYNEGYQGIKELFEAVGITPGDYLLETFSKLDQERIIRSANIIRNQQRRFAKKQRRGKKIKSQVRKHGQGYDSGKYTSAQPDVDSDAEDERPAPTTSAAPLIEADSDGEEDPLSPTTSLAVEVTDCCDICGYTEDEGIVGIGLGIALPTGDILWVQCAVCLKWFHLLCLGIEDEDLPEDEWNCGKC